MIANGCFQGWRCSSAFGVGGETPRGLHMCWCLWGIAHGDRVIADGH